MSFFITTLFGKAKCKLCGDSVRFALRHLEQKHPETLGEEDVKKLKMKKILEKYFE
jgi:hypothetical protein